MVAKISFGSSLYGALAYNGEKINKEEGKTLGNEQDLRWLFGKDEHRQCLAWFPAIPFSAHQNRKACRAYIPWIRIPMMCWRIWTWRTSPVNTWAHGIWQPAIHGLQTWDIDRHHMHIVTIRVDETASVWIADNYHRSLRLSPVTWGEVQSPQGRPQATPGRQSTFSARWM